MSELCSITGEECELLTAFHNLDIEVITLNTKNPRLPGLVEDLRKEHEAETLGLARKLCTPEECGIQRLGSIIALKSWGINQTNKDINPNL